MVGRLLLAQVIEVRVLDGEPRSMAQLVARVVWDDEAAGSSPATPTS
jgi:hypothetical protein